MIVLLFSSTQFPMLFSHKYTYSDLKVPRTYLPAICPQTQKIGLRLKRARISVRAYVCVCAYMPVISLLALYFAIRHMDFDCFYSQFHAKSNLLANAL